MENFLSGLRLSERLYEEVVRPALGERFPDLAHAAALVGWGSEVLGYDDARSTDHNWGPRLQLFLAPNDFERQSPAVLHLLDERLPATFYGRPVPFPIHVPRHQRALKDPEMISEQHQIELHTVPAFFQTYLGVNPEEELDTVDWLLLSENRLRGVTGGRVFHDGLGALHAAREKFAYYPDDVWRYLLSVQWARLAEAEAFVGRSAEVGDALGSRLIAARQIQLLIRLCFLQEREYAPYAKWVGTAFAHLDCATRLSPLFTQILGAEEWRERDRYLAAAYEIVAGRQNRLRLSPSLDPATRSYFDRPYRVLFAGRFADALLATVREETLRGLPFPAGSINQLVNSEIREDPGFVRWLRAAYEGTKSTAAPRD